MADEREIGTVKWFNSGKGYGFIQRENKSDVFVHFRNIVGTGHRSLNDGERVSFIVAQGEKGPQAMEVKVITDKDTVESSE